MKKTLIIIGAVVFLLIIIMVVVIAVFSKRGGDKNTGGFPAENLTLTYWRLYDEEDALKPIIQAYQEQHPNVTIKYVNKEPVEYETELVNAIAAGTGPDLFQIKNDWLPNHQDKISPMPSDLMSPQQYKDTFAPVAAQDLISEDKIYGIPFYIDTLALYYNKNLIQEYNKNISSEKQAINDAPKNWNEFIDQAKKLTQKSGPRIIQSGAALGSSNNIDPATDILSLLMIQNNTKMVSADKTTPTFNLSAKDATGKIIYPGTLALDFYTSFAKPTKETYSWNVNMPNAIDSFINGKTAMIIDYEYRISKIQNIAPDLQFGVAVLPQIKGTETRIDYANYWAETVSKDSKYPQVAWDFLKFASDKTWQFQYNATTKRPPSRPDVADSISGVANEGIFAQQIKTAVDWYKGKTATKVDNIFKDIIASVINQNQTPQKAIDAAAQKILSLWKTKE